MLNAFADFFRPLVSLLFILFCLLLALLITIGSLVGIGVIFFLNMLSWAVIGVAFGWLFDQIDPRMRENGWFTTCLVGIMSALFFGFWGSVALKASVMGWNWQIFLFVLVGTLVSLFVERNW